MNVKDELQNIISGNATVKFGENIQAIIKYIRRKKEAISRTEKAKFIKEQETKFLEEYIEDSNLWVKTIDFSKYIGEGAEQQVFESEDPNFVLKLNNCVFYEFWEDYLVSLLLHNYFFSHLAYRLVGFYKHENNFFAVVRQQFVKADKLTYLGNVREFLEANGFIWKRNNDYYHPELGIILEDLHDENVLTFDDTLQFIDTIFYLMPENNYE